MRFVPINPATGRALPGFRGSTHVAIATALAAAVSAQRAWRERPPAARAQFLRALARALLATRDELAALAVAEMGKPVAQARAEIEKCARACDYYAARGPGFLRAERPPGAAADARVVTEPLGVVLAIMPWNFPFWQVVRCAIPALLAGNAVLLKPAPNVPGCALALARAFAAAGFPPGLFGVLLVGHGRVPGLIADPRIRAVAFTGGTAAGKKIAALAGAAMKPGCFELGGSDAYLVLADADLRHAAACCAASRLMNAGQSCASAKRIIVERSVLKKFERLLVACVAARRPGDPADPATTLGPLARADLRAALARQVRGSVARGARLLHGGRALPGPGYFFAPTVLTDVRPGMPAADEELFGPVAAILPARDADDAVRLANATPYGLAAAVFTRDRARARRLAARLECGMVALNQFVRSSPELPFGGQKDSGHGRELGPWGLRAFTNVKAIVG